LSTPQVGPTTTPSFPLADDIRAAYQDLYDKLEAEYQSNPDATAREAIGPARDNVDDLLTKDNMCRFDADTALFSATLQQFKDANDGLKTLQEQIAATASHFSTAGSILAAIDKVFSFIS
jgi:hypothetical protein